MPLFPLQRAVEAVDQPVKIETETPVGKPVPTLEAESRPSVMACIGSIGTQRACRGGGFVVSVLPAMERSPVAVIYRPVRRAVAREVGGVVIEVHGVVL